MTPDQLSSEWKKCTDSKAYFYNTYIRRPEDPEITEQEMEFFINMAQRMAGNPLKPRVPGRTRHLPIRPHNLVQVTEHLRDVTLEHAQRLIDGRAIDTGIIVPLQKCQMSHPRFDGECHHPRCPELDGVTKCTLPWIHSDMNADDDH